MTGVCLKRSAWRLSVRPELADHPEQARGLSRRVCQFDAEQVAAFGQADVERLVQDAAIVRHRGKIESTINNARRVLELRREFGSLARYVWQYEPSAADRPAVLTLEAARAHVHRCIGGLVQRPEKARLELCRPHHGVCLHAGHGPGQTTWKAATPVPRRCRRAPPLSCRAVDQAR
jgi:hypothetical protein